MSTLIGPDLDYREKKPWTRKPWLPVTPSTEGPKLRSQPSTQSRPKQGAQASEAFPMRTKHLEWAGHVLGWAPATQRLWVLPEFQRFVVRENTQVNIMYCGKENNRITSPVILQYSHRPRYGWVGEDFTKDSCAKLVF